MRESSGLALLATKVLAVVELEPQVRAAVAICRQGVEERVRLGLKTKAQQAQETTTKEKMFLSWKKIDIPGY